jgi:cell volume regulation protein A
VSSFYGDFVIKPDARLIDLGTMYGFDVPGELREQTVGTFINRQFHHKPVVGDRVSLGKVEFVVRKLEADRIASVGLKF